MNTADMATSSPAEAPLWQAACGPFLNDFSARSGIALPSLLHAPAQPPVLVPGADPMRSLRLARAREWARIAVRDLAQVATLDATLCDLSDFADAACQCALDAAAAALASRFGIPRAPDGTPSRPIVLGMGKLGGRELNYSSDIDLIVAYTASGETDGRERLDNADYFARLVQAFVKLLAQRTEDGHVFRVDLMLRPFGSAGPVAISTEAMVDYYQAHGRDWERYALVKARPVAGDLAAGAALLAQLTPFVYRRYIDFDAIAGLRALKRKIAEDAAARRVAEDDLKVGAGGIRECEFIVQSFQLVRGGQQPALRLCGWRDTLHALVAAGHLQTDVAERLSAAYTLLRRAENAVQMWADEQTHALPQSEERQQALATATGFADYRAFTAALAAHRRVVLDLFNDVFAEPAQAPSTPVAQAVKAFWAGGEQPDSPRILSPDAGAAPVPSSLLVVFGDDAPQVGEALLALRRSGKLRAASPAALARLDELLPLLADDARQVAQSDTAEAACGRPAQAFTRALEVVEAVMGRSTYLTLLRESPTARQQLLTLCAASPWITQTLARYPLLLDQLLDARTLYTPPDRAAIRSELLSTMATLPPDAQEAAMDRLRRYGLETSLRIAAADVLRALPLPQVSDRLSWLAEAVLQAALDFARRELAARFGLPRRADGGEAGCVVIAYGKLGALEMGYGSDLDLVFVHDAEPGDADTRGGDRSLPASVWMARLAQKVVTLLATQTHLGRAYEVDVQLRPNGHAGLPVVTLAAFGSYQAEKAWTWEHQALTRARAVAGPSDLAAAFEHTRRAVLTSPRDAVALKAEIAAMREKMRAHLDRPPAGFWDVKQGRGGLVDVEFLVQHAVLRHAPAHPAVAKHPDVWRQLEALAEAGCWPAAQGQRLLAIQRAYRAWRHRAVLAGEAPMAPATAFTAEREWVTALWRDTFGEVAHPAAGVAIPASLPP